MYEELVRLLRGYGQDCTDNDMCKDCSIQYWCENGWTPNKIADAIEELVAAQPKWISATERLPKCEQEVLICTEKKIVGQNAYIDSIITPAIYEDGTMPECDSIWNWADIDFDEWDEENDCGIVPKGWWENRHFTPDEVYNNPVDRKVVAWMPLPEPYEPPKEDN